MSIRIVGAGIGRTGTLSLKYALEQLGYNKTYHMFELIQNSSHLRHWEDLEAGREPKWDELFAGYTATVDFPGAAFYKEILARYPDAKVILTVRDPEKWYKSASDTIHKEMPLPVKGLMTVLGVFNPKYSGLMKVMKFARRMAWETYFEGRFSDKAYALAKFKSHNEEVKRLIPADRLLVFEVKDGWQPLCDFLGVPVPDVPFPKVNDTQEFNDRKKNFLKKKAPVAS